MLSKKKICFICEKKFTEDNLYRIVVRTIEDDEEETDLFLCDKCGSILELSMKAREFGDSND